MLMNVESLSLNTVCKWKILLNAAKMCTSLVSNICNKSVIVWYFIMGLTSKNALIYTSILN